MVHVSSCPFYVCACYIRLHGGTHPLFRLCCFELSEASRYSVSFKVYVYVYVYVHVYVHVYVCVCIIYALMHVHIYILRLLCLFVLITWIVMSPLHRLHAARLTPHMCAVLEGRDPT